MKKYSIYIGALAIVVAALLWSFDGTFLRTKLFSLPSPLVVFLEHALGFIILIPFLFIYRGQFKAITKKQWVTIFWVALFGGALGTTFFTKALFLTGFVDISVVIILQKLQPVFAILLAGIFLHERFPARFYPLSVIAVISGYFVTFSDPWSIKAISGTTLAIAGYSLLAAFAWGSSTVFGKYSLKNISFGLLAALRFGLTILIMLVPAVKYFSNIPTVTTGQWGVFAAIVFSSGAVAMFIYYFGLKRVPASVSTLCELAWPVSAIFFDYYLNGNALAWSQYLGALVLVAAVTYITLLNKSYVISGVVGKGQARGEEVGAKTANLDLALAKDLPKGLYKCEVLFDNQKYEGLLYYGINSLSDVDCLEVHLVNYSGDLYGKTITVVTDRYVRFPKKFTTAQALAVQIGKDLKNVNG